MSEPAITTAEDESVSRAQDTAVACPFCLENRLLTGEMFASNDDAYLVETGDPVLVWSMMIIPIRHVATPFEITGDEWSATQALLLEAKRLLDRQAPDGYSIGWNVGEVGGQEVPHAHLHVIARFADEPLAGRGIRHALRQPANRRPDPTH